MERDRERNREGREGEGRDNAGASILALCARLGRPFGRPPWSVADKAFCLKSATAFKVIGTNLKLTYDFLLVINTNLMPILHCFWDIAFDRIKTAIFLATPLAFNPPPSLTEGFSWDDLRKIFYGVETLPKISTGWVGCTSVTDRWQTDGRQHIANVNASSRC